MSHTSNTDQTLEKLKTQVRKTGEARAALAQLTGSDRTRILHAIAEALEMRTSEILAANQLDLTRAQETELAPPLLRRLSLNESKLQTLARGIREIAEMPDPLGQTLEITEVSPELVLEQVSAPLGTLLVIFESRPD